MDGMYEQQDQEVREANPPQGQDSQTSYDTAQAQRTLNHGKLRKSPVLACLLSLMPGLGQVYVGYYQRGFIHVLIVGTIIMLLNKGVAGMEPLLGIFIAFFWLYNVIDAGRRAVFYNLAVEGSETIELPTDFQMPRKGSLGWGIGLIAAGFVLFLNTRFDLSLDWVADYWPLFLVGFGVYLMVKWRQNN